MYVVVKEEKGKENIYHLQQRCKSVFVPRHWAPKWAFQESKLDFVRSGLDCKSRGSSKKKKNLALIKMTHRLFESPKTLVLSK